MARIEPPPILPPTAPPIEPVRVATIPPEVTDRRIFAGVLAIVLGWLGVHKFVLGRTGTGVIMLILTITVVGYPFMHLISIIEGILYLTRSDEEFYRTYIVGTKRWF
ncbi:MAG: TM2 domain-containing protein [Phycisphaerales bacterium]